MAQTANAWNGSQKQGLEHLPASGAEPEQGTGSLGAAPLLTSVMNMVLEENKPRREHDGCWLPANTAATALSTAKVRQQRSTPGRSCNTSPTQALRKSASEAHLQGRNAVLHYLIKGQEKSTKNLAKVRSQENTGPGFSTVCSTPSFNHERHVGRNTLRWSRAGLDVLFHTQLLMEEKILQDIKACFPIDCKHKNTISNQPTFRHAQRIPCL